MATEQQQPLVWVEPSTNAVKKDSSSSFASKSVWARLGSSASTGDLKEAKAGRSRFSRIINRDNGKVEGTQKDGEDAGTAKTAAQHRREQVYQAQKRHRNRRAAYVQTLESQVANLEHLKAVAQREKYVLEKQNREMLGLLEASNLAAEQLAMFATTEHYPDALMRDFDVDIRLDELIGHERTFLDMPSLMSEMTTSSTQMSPSNISEQTSTSVAAESGPDESWASADFILALEWPCRGHIHHSVLNPPPLYKKLAANAGIATNHALTATAAVFDSSLIAVPGSHTTSRSASKSPTRDVVLPYIEIEKLVRLSELLPLDEISLTPAQAYSAIRKHVPQGMDLSSVLSALKVPLSQTVSCQGFGAVMSSEDFWYHFRQIMPGN